MPRTQAHCPLCGADTAEHVVKGYDRFVPRPEDWDYVRCAGCGLVHQEPLPAPDAIAGFYPAGYHAHGEGRKRRERWLNRMAKRYYYATDSVGRSPALRGLFRLLSGRILAGLRPPHGQNRLLDVGCASGNQMLRYRELGWDVTGIEVGHDACELARARGLTVHEGTVFDAPFDGSAFDLVILSHVIEHVLEPERVLAACAGFLAPGGVLTLSTPNADSLGLARYGSCWYSLDAPRHLMLFNPRTLRILGERAGLTVRKIVTKPETRLLCESRHYLETQGRELPASLAERRRIVEDSSRAKKSYKGYKKLVQPLAAVNAWRQRGEVLEAELVRA